MSSIDKQPYKREVRNEVMATKGYVRVQKWTAPAAASATSVLNAHNLDGSTQQAAAQPDKARTLQYVASGATTANVTVNGTDIHGNAVSETVALNGTTIVHGTHAFATITSVVLPTVATTTVNVGTDVSFGLDRVLPGNTVFVYDVDGATDSAAPTVTSNSTADSSVSLNTVKFATAPNGTHNFLVCFVSQEVTTYTGTSS